MTRRPPPWCSPPRRRPELRSPTPTERRDAAAADEPGRSGSAGTAARTTPEAKAPHPTGLCRASSNIATNDHPGKAADSPAFADLSCTDADARATTPTPRPPPAPGGRPHRCARQPRAADRQARRRRPRDGRHRRRGHGRGARQGGRLGAAAHADTERPRQVGRAPPGRLTRPLQTRRAVRRRYSQSRTVSPVPWSYRAASAARSWSSAATRSGSPAMLRYAAIVGP